MRETFFSSATSQAADTSVTTLLDTIIPEMGRQFLKMQGNSWAAIRMDWDDAETMTLKIYHYPPGSTTPKQIHEEAIVMATPDDVLYHVPLQGLSGALITLTNDGNAKTSFFASVTLHDEGPLT